MLESALLLIAIVTQDHVALRAAPRASAAQQVMLTPGDSLEIRGRKGDYLQVYDHRHERAGYVRSTQVREQSLQAQAAPELLAVLRFLRDTPGAESLGLGYVAAFLRAAPAQSIDAEVFDALGTLAERLAQRATGHQSKAQGEALAAQLALAASYGVAMNPVERDGAIRLCYSGEAHRRVMALPASAEQKARAALALTQHECVDPDLSPLTRFALDNWRAEVLQRVETTELAQGLKNRLLMRQAGVWSALAFQRARRSEFPPTAVQAAAQRALQALASVNKAELDETDWPAYNDAAIRVGASRWAAEPATLAPTPSAPHRLAVQLSPGEAGQTCVHLVDATHGPSHPLLSRCTYGVVWSASAAVNRAGTALALAVQPLDSWREMWVFQQGVDGWRLDVVPPALQDPGLGYVEFSGWVAGKAQLLATRDTKENGRYQTRFQVLHLSSLEVDKQAEKPAHLSTFYRWQDPLWKAQTVSLR